MSVVAEISQQLFEAFRGCVPPPEQWQAPSKKHKAEEIARSLDKLYDKARELRRQHRPGVLARARIVLALQRQMLAAGYPGDMSREVLFSLILSAFVGKV